MTARYEDIVRSEMPLRSAGREPQRKTPMRFSARGPIQTALAALAPGAQFQRHCFLPHMAKSSTTGRALAFDAYGTLFDVFSVTALCEQLFPGKGTQLAQTWRVKQLQYSLMRSLMGRHRDFWGLTEDGLVWASKSLKVDLTADNKKQLMDAYLALAAFPDVKPGLQALKQQGLKLAILSNGEPKMLEAAAKSAGIRDLLDEIISVERRSPGPTSDHVRFDHQPSDRQGIGTDRAADAARPRRRGDRMRPREFITLLGGAVAFPVAPSRRSAWFASRSSNEYREPAMGCA
jgi:2-haloalkanoic acid dehalogenase type II